MSQVAPQTLDIVGREIGGELNDARTALEAFVEQPDNVALLERCAGELHRVQGVLRVLEIYGAALLAEEMVHVTRYLVETAADRRNQAESLDALLRAMVQLPSYLERVLAGGRDLALVLLPLLNDLRAVRGSPLLSEGTLLLLNLKSEEVPAPPPAAPGSRKPDTERRRSVESSASFEIATEVALVESAVWRLISFSTCMLRVMLCDACACWRELPEMFCTRLAIWFETFSISSSAAPAFSASSAPPTTSVVLRSIETTASLVSAWMVRTSTSICLVALAARCSPRMPAPRSRKSRTSRTRSRASCRTFPEARASRRRRRRASPATCRC